ncbi:MAG: 30S ribosomal protein S17 [Candidatus Blackburnbacteria bacterium]|nr:30S ribosomal protein S17 [Candidatus Blackburnbacteria bacterium]
MKVFIGKVKSVSLTKTVIVEVERFRVHPIYEKRTRSTKRYPVHDEIGVKERDVVEFKETRPISKTKRWMITRVLGKRKEEERETLNAKRQMGNKRKVATSR